MRRLAIAVCAAALAFPAAAGATTVEVLGATVVVRDAPGEQSDVHGSGFPGGITFSDFQGTLAAGPGCEREDENWVTCRSGFAPFERIELQLGDRNDHGSVSYGEDDGAAPAVSYSGGDGDDTGVLEAGPAVVDGGAGDDNVTGGAAADVLRGGPGDDQLDGAGGDDRLDGEDGGDGLGGGPGDDRVAGGPGMDRMSGEMPSEPPGRDVLTGDDGPDSISGGGGADDISGGEGYDGVAYGGSEPVRASLDGQGGDGAPGENDFIHGDVEYLAGGEGDDVLVGDGAANELRGSGGRDELIGGGGDDRLDGDAGDDMVLGGDGDDSLRGGNGDDALTGGEGRDDLAGGPARDRLDSRDFSPSPPSTDWQAVNAWEATRREYVQCGAGDDEAQVDQTEQVEACERVARPDGSVEVVQRPTTTGSWQEPEELAGATLHPRGGGIAVTPEGDAVIAWLEFPEGAPAGRVAWTVRRAGGELEPVRRLPGAARGVLRLVPDRRGGVVAVWQVERGIATAYRPPGGELALESQIEMLNADSPILVANRRGDAALVLYDQGSDPRRWRAAIRPAGGAWGPLTAIDDGAPPFPWARTAALTDDGRLVLAAVHERERLPDGHIDRTGSIATATYVPGGGPARFQEIGAADALHASPQLAVDPGGRAALVWHDPPDGWGGSRALLSVAEPGGAFGAPSALGGSGYRPEIAADDAGRFWIVDSGSGTRLLSFAGAGPPVVDAEWSANASWGGDRLEVSPAGRMIVGLNSSLELPLTAGRDAPGAPFGPVQDLVPSCDGGQSADLALGDAGPPVAVFERRGALLVSAQAPWQGLGLQECADARSYLAPGDPLPPFGRGPGTPAWHADAPCRTRNPPASCPRPAAAAAAKPRLRLVALTRAAGGRELRAALRVRCRTRCRPRAVAALRRHGRVLARGSARARKARRAQALTVRVRLGRRARRVVRRAARTGRRIQLHVRVRAQGRTSRTVVRSRVGRPAATRSGAPNALGG